MLTEEGYRARFWGPFSALRRVLEEEELPGSYYGLTSASDNIFEEVGRHLKLAILVQEHRTKLVNAAKVDTELGRVLLSDLKGVREKLRDSSGRFAEQSERVERLLEDLFREASRAPDQDNPNRKA